MDSGKIAPSQVPFVIPQSAPRNAKLQALGEHLRLDGYKPAAPLQPRLDAVRQGNPAGLGLQQARSAVVQEIPANRPAPGAFGHVLSLPQCDRAAAMEQLARQYERSGNPQVIATSWLQEVGGMGRDDLRTLQGLATHETIRGVVDGEIARRLERARRQGSENVAKPLLECLKPAEQQRPAEALRLFDAAMEAAKATLEKSGHPEPGSAVAQRVVVVATLARILKARAQTNEFEATIRSLGALLQCLPTQDQLSIASISQDSRYLPEAHALLAKAAYSCAFDARVSAVKARLTEARARGKMDHPVAVARDLITASRALGGLRIARGDDLFAGAQAQAVELMGVLRSALAANAFAIGALDRPLMGQLAEAVSDLGAPDLARDIARQWETEFTRMSAIATQCGFKISAGGEWTHSISQLGQLANTQLRFLDGRPREKLAEMYGLMSQLDASSRPLANAFLDLGTIQTELAGAAIWQHPLLAGQRVGSILESKGGGLAAFQAQFPTRMKLLLATVFDEARKASAGGAPHEVEAAIRKFTAAAAELDEYVAGCIARIKKGQEELAAIQAQTAKARRGRDAHTYVAAGQLLSTLNGILDELEKPQGAVKLIRNFCSEAQRNPRMAATVLAPLERAK